MTTEPNVCGTCGSDDPLVCSGYKTGYKPNCHDAFHDTPERCLEYVGSARCSHNRGHAGYCVALYGHVSQHEDKPHG